MTETFTPPRNPDVGAAGQTSFAVDENEFGDGYSQSSAEGINSERRTISLVWSKIPPTDADTIKNFLNARGGTEPFYYTEPFAASATLWKCKGWSRTFHETAVTISATFKLAYDPV